MHISSLEVATLESQLREAASNAECAGWEYEGAAIEVERVTTQNSELMREGRDSVRKLQETENKVRSAEFLVEQLRREIPDQQSNLRNTSDILRSRDAQLTQAVADRGEALRELASQSADVERLKAELQDWEAYFQGEGPDPETASAQWWGMTSRRARPAWS